MQFSIPLCQFGTLHKYDDDRWQCVTIWVRKNITAYNIDVGYSNDIFNCNIRQYKNEKEIVKFKMQKTTARLWCYRIIKWMFSLFV